MYVAKKRGELVLRVKHVSGVCKYIVAQYVDVNCMYNKGLTN